MNSRGKPNPGSLCWVRLDEVAILVDDESNNIVFVPSFPGANPASPLQCLAALVLGERVPLRRRCGLVVPRRTPVSDMSKSMISFGARAFARLNINKDVIAVSGKTV
jgi:hypothetical protein